MKNKLFIVVIALMVSCSPFDTRNPEEPDNSSSNYIPPTSPEIVIQNFTASLVEKNLDNYMNCFTASKAVSDVSYNFVPSPQSLENFPNIFNNWQLEDERRFFTALISNAPQNIAIEIEFEDNVKGFESRTPDSALFVSDYIIKVPDDDKFTSYSGSLQFNIISTNNSLWRINKWVDNSAGNDSLETWSFLKGKLY